MIQDQRVYLQEARPVAELMKSINSSYRLAYEFDRDDYRVGNRFLDEGMGSTREKWGLDLSRIEPVNNGGHSHWGNNLENLQDHILYHVVCQAVNHNQELEDFFKDRESERESHFKDSFRNLTNAWRDEYALNAPFHETSESRTDTAEWRIIQTYYSVYKATSALLRSKFDTIRRGQGNHASLWRFHREECMDELQEKLYPFPFLYFPADDNPRCHDYFDWVTPYPIHDELYEEQSETQNGYVESALEGIYEEAKTIPYFEDEILITFYDLLKSLREWAQYHQGGIFSRLFGDTHIKALDHALRLLSFTGIAVAEVALICAFGISDFEEVYNEYRNSCYAGNIPDSLRNVSRRVDVYRQAFPVFNFDIEVDADVEDS
jgi:hypothetical protein